MVSKNDVSEFWGKASCGEALYLDESTIEGYRRQMAERYRLEPHILEFAEFGASRGKRVLEIGVGLGADHQRFAEAGAVLSGVDLTDRAISHVRRRFDLLGLQSELRVGDAENLPFPDATFDVVYSFGVIHHSPDTPKAAQEVLRVLKPGGEFRIMVYHRRSLIGLMLWLRYGLMRGLSLDEVYSRYLESPGTKAYSCAEAAALFSGATRVQARTVITHGDLLDSAAGQRHEGVALSIARVLWPRWLFRRADSLGLHLLVRGTK